MRPISIQAFVESCIDEIVYAETHNCLIEGGTSGSKAGREGGQSAIR